MNQDEDLKLFEKAHLDIRDKLERLKGREVWRISHGDANCKPIDFERHSIKVRDDKIYEAIVLTATLVSLVAQKDMRIIATAPDGQAPLLHLLEEYYGSAAMLGAYLSLDAIQAIHLGKLLWELFRPPADSRPLLATFFGREGETIVSNPYDPAKNTAESMGRADRLFVLLKDQRLIPDPENYIIGYNLQVAMQHTQLAIQVVTAMRNATKTSQNRGLVAKLRSLFS